MILAIAIISGVMWIMYFLHSCTSPLDGEQAVLNLFIYTALCVLSTWYLSVGLGIVFLCVMGVLSCLAAIKAVS